jgi:uncharacterized protein (TIGR02147 family)
MQVAKKSRANTFLKNYYLRRKRGNSTAWSIRAIARRLGVSPSFISRIMQGTKNIPRAKVRMIAEAFGMDAEAAGVLESLLEESDIESPPNKLVNYIPLDTHQNTHLIPWYKVAILDLTECSNFLEEPQIIAQRLKITVEQVEIALSELLHAGILVRKNGRLVKVEAWIRFPAKAPDPKLQAYHRQMITQSLAHLEAHANSPRDYEKRYFPGITFAGSSANIGKAKEILARALHEAAAVMSEGDATQVFQLQLQLFSLSDTD